MIRQLYDTGKRVPGRELFFIKKTGLLFFRG
jgi:hypothetical protein